jgi:plasmid stabilization system protein ParE
VNWRIVWTDNAIAGVREVGAFHDELQPGLGSVHVNAIFDRMEEQREFPESAPVHPKAEDPRVRRLVFKKFVVVYRIIENGHRLQVLSVRHQRQRPVEPDELP